MFKDYFHFHEAHFSFQGLGFNESYLNYSRGDDVSHLRNIVIHFLLLYA